ncbi:hypothetical protein [Adhaeribacter aquaticus]|uniref:hypothetical protein n=1 Tax=Adhaeribacter aquaticus TaxID=299567 RepID=UPI0004076452|nr:hypothetical protein [Adhaeribacter aquaticus]
MTTSELKAKIENAALMALMSYASEYGLETTGTYTYAIKDIQNMNYDKPLPHIYCEELRIRVDKRAGVIEWPNTGLAFLDQDQEDSSAEQMEAIKERMEFLAHKFFDHLTDNDDMEDMPYELEALNKINMGRFSGYGSFVNIRSVIGC